MDQYDDRFDDDLSAYEEEQVFRDREFETEDDGDQGDDDDRTVQNLGSYNDYDGVYPCDRCGKDTPGNGAYPLIFCPTCRPRCGLLLPD